jgi:hypothetical protein
VIKKRAINLCRKSHIESTSNLKPAFTENGPRSRNDVDSRQHSGQAISSPSTIERKKFKVSAARLKKKDSGQTSTATSSTNPTSLTATSGKANISCPSQLERDRRSLEPKEKNLILQQQQQICDRVVADYLKRNGFKDVLKDFQGLPAQSATTNRSGHFVPLEELIEMSSSKKKVPKTSSKDEMRLDDWINLCEGFADLIPLLDPDDTESEVDKVVSFILNQNILVRYINVKYRSYSIRHVYNHSKEKSDMKQNYPEIKIGRFSIGSNGEDGIIKSNWEKLILEAKIKDPVKCIADFKSKLRGGKGPSLFRSNVLGAYLGQALPYIRLGCDVFSRAVTLFYLNNKGHYTKEEDALILETVEKLGANNDTFKHLAQLLKKPNTSGISGHYNRISKFKGTKSGTWTSADFEVLFDYIFKTANSGETTGPEYIRSVSQEVVSAAAKLLNRVPKNVWQHWTEITRPTLLAYHNGTLHTDWKTEFFEYLVDKKVKAIQDIDWQEAQSHFPIHTSASLKDALKMVRLQEKFRCQPLFVSILDYLPKWNNSLASKKGFNYREKMVYLYDKARGVLK